MFDSSRTSPTTGQIDEPSLSGTVVSVARTSGKTPLPIHALLRETTRDVHERLHAHDGFASVQDGTIGLPGYRGLLVRLYGFYVPFEAAAGIARDRSAWLADDLRALGLDGDALAAIPRCADLPRLDDDLRRLGALYVVEGSTLGGRDLFKSLDRLLGADATAGRRFFFGRGLATGTAWKNYLSRLAEASSGPAESMAIAGAAAETFDAFEHWLTGWSNTTHESN